MTTVVWTERALSDVEAIRDYIARDSETAAAHMVARFLGAVDLVAQFPRAGRVVPELEREDLRERILGNYRIVYRNPSSKCLACAHLSLITSPAETIRAGR